MKKYFYLQLKRIAKILPFVLAVAMALLIGLVAVLYGVLATFNNSEDNKRYTIAVAGDTDNEYMSWGLAAMQTFDESRFSIDFVEMTETEANQALKKGEISAYVIMPEDFVEMAVLGDIEPITYVTSTGAEGLVSLFKKEITALITKIVVYSQKGAYGLGEVLDDNGLGRFSYTHMNEISIEYTNLIFHRGELYSVSELGVSEGLSTQEYYIVAIAVMLLVLMGMPFATVYIKKDYAFNRLLYSRGYSPNQQLACEYVTYLIAMFLQTAVLLIAICIMGGIMPETVSSNSLADVMTNATMKIIPVVIMISAFNIMMFELSNNMVSGLLLHFFAAISLCYVSGCMYPIYAFPKAIKNLSTFLPTGIARSYLATSFTFEPAGYNFAGLVLYTIAFYGIALFVRFRKTRGIRG